MMCLWINLISEFKSFPILSPLFLLFPPPPYLYGLGVVHSNIFPHSNIIMKEYEILGFCL